MILSFCLLFTRGMVLPELRVCQANIVTELSVPPMTMFGSTSKSQGVETGHSFPRYIRYKAILTLNKCE